MGWRRSTKAAAGRIPGLDLALYGSLLVLAIAFAPNGVHGLLARLRGGLASRSAS